MRLRAFVLSLVSLAATNALAAPLTIPGAPCARPPVQHCPDAGCAADVVTSGGAVAEPKTNRTYFLDYPCDLKRGEKVTFILSLHGGGSYGNWQRHYFPLLDYTDKYRLVVATPFSPRRVWSAEDDAYLQNIVSSVIDAIGRENVKSFWLAGHSQGGLTSSRIICSDFFATKVDGFLSLSGGRVGGQAGRATNFGIPAQAGAATAGRATPPAGLPAGALVRRHRRCATSRTSSKPASTRSASCRRSRRGRKSTNARGRRSAARSSTRMPATCSMAPVRILARRPGGSGRVRARPTFLPIASARTAASSPTSCAWTRGTLKASSRR